MDAQQLYGIVSSIWGDVAAHQYVLAAAVLAGLLVAAIKQGWGGAWLAAHLPPKARPWLAVVIAVVGTVADALQTGAPIGPAIVQGLMAAATAVFGHQVVVEGARSGKEIVPAAPWCRPQDPPKA